MAMTYANPRMRQDAEPLVKRRSTGWGFQAADRHDYLEKSEDAEPQLRPFGRSQFDIIVGINREPVPEMFTYWRDLLQDAGRRHDERAVKFAELNEWWQRETAFAPPGVSRFMHPAYQQIIGGGWPSLIPLLVALRDEPDHYFWALSAITAEDPAVGMETFDEAREAWLGWGRDRGLLR